jgi:UPF0755 protein
MRASARRAVWAAAFVGLSLLVAALLVSSDEGPPGSPVRVTVPQGSSFRVAADSLARVGLIRFPRAFGFYASLRGRDRDLKAGTYVLRRGTSWAGLLDALSLGRGLVRVVTIPEGWGLSQIVAQVSRALPIPAESLDVATRDTALLRRLDIPTPTLEGYLFPETYVFPVTASAREVVRTMVEQFERRWKPDWDGRLQALAMTRNDVMALAAIIEKEARLPEERPVISAVYHNRLKRGMLLQADPTVQFALGTHKSRVLYRDLEVDSKYNTYKYPGLPPGPIASPGLPSIEAALFPANVPYLYFVAHPDGHHEFRTTFAEHVKAVREMRAVARAVRARAADSAAKVVPPGGAPRGPKSRG